MSSFAIATHIFSAKKFPHICVTLDINFNELLTYDVVSFEQLGPDTDLSSMLVGIIFIYTYLKLF